MDKSKRTSVIMLVIFFVFVAAVLVGVLANAGVFDALGFNKLIITGDRVPDGTKWTFSGVSDVSGSESEKNGATNSIINSHATAVITIINGDEVQGDPVIYEDYVLMQDGVVTVVDYVGDTLYYSAAGLGVYLDYTEKEHTVGTFSGSKITVDDDACPYGYSYKKVYVKDDVLYMKIQTADGTTATVTFKRVTE